MKRRQSYLSSARKEIKASACRCAKDKSVPIFLSVIAEKMCVVRARALRLGSLKRAIKSSRGRQCRTRASVRHSAKLFIRTIPSLILGIAVSQATVGRAYGIRGYRTLCYLTWHEPTAGKLNLCVCLCNCDYLWSAFTSLKRWQGIFWIDIFIYTKIITNRNRTSSPRFIAIWKQGE